MSVPAQISDGETRAWRITARRMTLLATFMVLTQMTRVEGCPQNCRCQPLTATVYCRSSRLTEVPRGIPDDTRILRLENNRIFKLPTSGDLYHLKNLQELYLDNNDISKIQRRSLPKSLQHLYLDGNALTAIQPHMFRQLDKLERLHLNSNNISKIALLAFPRNLEYLQLDFNKMISIKVGQFSYLHNLRHLFMNSNRISRIKEGAFPPKLRFIRLGQNLMEKIDLQFSSMEHLRVLYLYSNKIRTISDKAFSHLPQLLDLSLLDNRLTTIQAHLFENLTELTDLNLYKNRVRTIREGALPPAGKLQRLYLHKNPIRCSCQDEWVAKRLRVEKLNTVKFDFFFYDTSIPEEARPFDYPHEEDIVCGSPIPQQGKRISEVDFASFCKHSVTTVLPGVSVLITDTFMGVASTTDSIAAWLRWRLNGNTGPPPVSAPSDIDLRRWLGGQTTTEDPGTQKPTFTRDFPARKSGTTSTRDNVLLLTVSAFLSFWITFER